MADMVMSFICEIEKVIDRYSRKSLGHLKYFDHVPAFSPVFQRDEITLFEAFFIGHFAKTWNKPCRPPLDLF